MVEVDIQVPDIWPNHMKHDLTPYEYFSEMSPLFCSSDIPFNSIGEHMQQHAHARHMSEKSRRLLVGGI